MWTVLVGPCAHHVAPSTEYPECPSSEYSTAVTLCIIGASFLLSSVNTMTLGPNHDLL